jgi:hypothetical protein
MSSITAHPPKCYNSIFDQYKKVIMVKQQRNHKKPAIVALGNFFISHNHMPFLRKREANFFILIIMIADISNC